MKKLLITGSLATIFLITGCSQKGSVGADGSGSANAGGKGYISGSDNFATLDDRISHVEGGLQNIFFDFDQFTIRSDMQGAVSNDANVLKSSAVGPLTVRIEGNTDEWGTDEYNYALGLKRAVAVRDALVAQGVSQDKTVLVSYGESKPTCTAKTRECWAENRKVTFKMLP